MRAGYLTFALAALGLVLVGALVGPTAPGPTTVSAALGLDEADDVELDHRRALAVAIGTAACMRARGFAYEPIPEPGLGIPDPDLDPIAWAERWGFGVTTSVGVPSAAPVPDVNAARAERLPASDRERYDRALHGRGAEPGCHGTATATVYGLRDRALEPLRADLLELDRAIGADPGMDGVRRDWAACARASIEPLGTSAAPVDRERLQPALLGWFATRLQAARSREALADAQRLEREVAASLARCESAHAAGRALVAIPYEHDFLNEHGRTLARIGAAIRTAEDALPTLSPRATAADR